MNIKRLTAALLLATAAVAPAYAGDFLFHYQADPSQSGPDTVVTADLRFTTSGPANQSGAYLITDITGTVDGNVIDTFYPNPNYPDYTVQNGYYFDDEYYSDWGFSINGVLIGSGSTLYNFGYLADPNQPQYFYVLKSLIDGPGPTQISEGVGITTPANVPEPAAWTMMVTGFGLAGATMRRRRTTIAFI